MRTALLRLAPKFSFAVLVSDITRRVMYDTVQIVPGRPAPSVLLNHDGDQRIGEVLDLFEAKDTALGRTLAVPWLYARVRLDDDAPAWISRGSPTWIGTRAGHVLKLDGWEVRRRAFLDEVSILSPADPPREPLARVVYLSKQEQVPATRSATPTTGWRANLPPGWEALRDIPGLELQPGEELIEGPNPSSPRPGYRWDGAKFLAVR